MLVWAAADRHMTDFLRMDGDADDLAEYHDHLRHLYRSQ